MPSPAATKYMTLVASARVLQRPLPSGASMVQKQTHLHAALAAHVAAWDAYINELVRCFFIEVSDPLEIKYSRLHSLAHKSAEKALEKFNTPNWQNTRTLLVTTTGYDPIGDWTWTFRRMSGPMVRERLDEILKVRHSFAHGFPMPTYSWTQSARGTVRLTRSALSDTDAFFGNLVAKTDNGMRSHIISSYSVLLGW